MRNSSEAIPRAGSKAAVTLAGNKAGARIEIADHGSGIEPAILGTLIEFGTSTKEEQGNGMGVWSVKHILNKHLRRITVPSAPGQGTRFNLWCAGNIWMEGWWLSDSRS